MVRAVVRRVERRARGREAGADVRVDALDRLDVDHPLRDARLVGDHHEREPRALEHHEGLGGVGEQAHALEAIDVARLLDERAVAVEEHGRPQSAHRSPRRSIHSMTWAAIAAGSMRRMQR